MIIPQTAAPSALLIVAAATPCFAQTPAPEAPVELDAVIVTGRRDPDDSPATAEARALAARTPGAVAVVSVESYRHRFAQGFPDSLRNVPGVLAQKRYGEESRLSIRGSGIGQSYHQRGVLFAQDGIPVTDADGFSDYESLDQLGATHIEVFRGGNALRFGAAQLGGAINMVSPTGRTAAGPLSLQEEAGSWGFRRLRLEAAASTEAWDGFLGLTALESDGWREHTDQSQGRITAGLGRAFGPDRELRLDLQAFDVQQSVVSGVTLEEALRSPRRAPANNISNDTARDQTQRRAALRGRWRLTPGHFLEGAVWGSAKALDHPVFQVIRQDSETWGTFGRGDWSGQLAGRAADVVYGFSWREGDLDGERFVNLGGKPGARTASNRQRASGLDVFAEGRLFLMPRLAVVAGGSWGRATRDYADRLDPSNDDQVTYEWASPRIGLMWEGPSGHQAFANITRTVEPPTYGSLVQPPSAGFVPLYPQDAWTAEVGARGRWGGLSWDLAAYRSRIDGELLNFIVGPDIPAQTFNAGETLHQGLEAGLDWRPDAAPAGGRLLLRQTWTYSDFRFRDDPRWGDNILPVAPEHLYRAELTWRRGADISLTSSLEWRPQDVWVDYANTLRAPGFAVIGVSASKALGGGVTIYADLRNLADARFVPEFSAVTDARLASTRVFFPGEGRSAFVGLRVSH